MQTFHPNCFYRNNSGFTRSSILPRTAHSSPTMQDKSRRRHHKKREVLTSLFYYKLKKYAQSKNGINQYLHDLLMCPQKVIADCYNTSVWQSLQLP